MEYREKVFIIWLGYSRNLQEAEEILNLHIYLEGKKDREKLLKKYKEWTKPPRK